MIAKSALSNANVTGRRSEDNRERARPRFTAVYRNLFLRKTQSFPPRRHCSIRNEINTRRNLRRHPRCHFIIILVIYRRLFTDARAFRVSVSKLSPTFRRVVNSYRYIVAWTRCVQRCFVDEYSPRISQLNSFA